jgi:hypothetical protein
MSSESGLWREGGRAWERLAEWYRDGDAAPAERGDPLAVLSDVGLVRRLLDDVELEAVRSARRGRRSWAEIATKLGVTRQSAWERWRDLDVEPAEPARPVREGRPEAGAEAADVAAFALEQATRQAGRTPWVVVPDVVGLTFDEARTVLVGRGLVAVSSDPVGPSVAELAARGAVVRDQSPESGATAQPGSPVTLWAQRGGGSGVREPRRPKPTPRVGRKYLEEPTESSEQALG